MTAERHRYVIGARKIPQEQRDVAAAVLADSEARYWDVIDSDDDPSVPVGADTTYVAYLTDDAVERFRWASNCRYIELDQVDSQDARPPPTQPPADDEDDPVDTVATIAVPSTAAMAWLGADFAGAADWDGSGVIAAVLDGGTTPAVKADFGWTIRARQNFSASTPGADEITTDHGCKVTPLAVPPATQLVEAVVFDDAGNTTHSQFTAALKWACDNGALVANYSGSGTTSSNAQLDGINYAAARGVQLYCSAGNDSAYRLNFPSAHCRTHPNVHSSIAFSEVTDTLGAFSNHHEDGSGCAPGVATATSSSTATLITASGTSFSCPLMARMCIMGMTDGRFGQETMAGALDGNTRNTPAPATDEGHGAYNLENALNALGAFVPPSPPPVPAEDVAAAVVFPLVRATAFTPASAAVNNSYADAIEDLQIGLFSSLDHTARPLFKVVRTSSLTVTTAVDTVVTWQSPTLDPDDMWDPSTPTRISIRTAGVWLFQSQVRMLYVNATGIRGNYISKNTTTGQTNILAGSETAPTISPSGDIVTLSTFVPVTTSDAIYFRVYHTAGTNVTVDWQLYGGTALSGVWLGPL